MCPKLQAMTSRILSFSQSLWACRRTRTAVSWALVLAASPGCRGGSSPTSRPSVFSTGAQADEQGSVEDVSIQLEVDKTRVLQKEADLLSSSQALAAQRATLDTERAQAEEKLKSISQADKTSRAKAEAEQTNIIEQQRLLHLRQGELESARAQLDKDKTALLTRAVKPPASAAVSQDASAASYRLREEAIVRREGSLAAREKQLTEREVSTTGAIAELKSLIEALHTDINELKEAPLSTPQPPSATGAATTKAQVLRQVRLIRQKMSQKGMLNEDLPQGMQRFAQLATQASNARDTAACQALCDRVAQSVDATPINHAFVEAKMARINRSFSVHSGKLDDVNQKKVQDLLSEATDAFSDGRYDRANKKINQICALLPEPEAR